MRRAHRDSEWLAKSTGSGRDGAGTSSEVRESMNLAADSCRGPSFQIILSPHAQSAYGEGAWPTRPQIARLWRRCCVSWSAR